MIMFGAYLSGATLNFIVRLTRSIFPVATLISPLDTASKVYISNTAPYREPSHPLITAPSEAASILALRFAPLFSSLLSKRNRRLQEVTNRKV